MPTSEFILQGFRAETHLGATKWVLACPFLDRAIFSVAFVNEGGVTLLAPELQAIGSRLTVLAGIRNPITSRQGLERLLGLGSILYAVDTGGRSPLFHPKVFFAVGPAEARLVIGSANLTAGGLNNNIEAGVKLSFNRGDVLDEGFVTQLMASFDGLPTQHPANVIRITASAELLLLEKSGRLLDESLVQAPSPSTTASKPAADTVPKIKLLVQPIYSAPKKPTPVAAVVPPAPPGVVPPMPTAWQKVWTSKPLTERDLSIPKGKNTHPTGSINLDKGLLPAGVDHRHYFREEVFDGLDWTSSGATVDEATGIFQLVVKDIEYGEALLRIAHSHSTTSRAYLQRNAMTRLSWGPLKEFVSDAGLLQRRLTLYRDANDFKQFLIEID